jgi:hypothetical protein
LRKKSNISSDTNSGSSRVNTVEPVDTKPKYIDTVTKTTYNEQKYIDMQKIICFILLVLLIILTSTCSITKNKGLNNNMTTINYVPNEETAIKIAEAIWLPIYGEKDLQSKPYIVSLLKA